MQPKRDQTESVLMKRSRLLRFRHCPITFWLLLATIAVGPLWPVGTGRNSSRNAVSCFVIRLCACCSRHPHLQTTRGWFPTPSQFTAVSLRRSACSCSSFFSALTASYNNMYSPRLESLSRTASMTLHGDTPVTPLWADSVVTAAGGWLGGIVRVELQWRRQRRRCGRRRRRRLSATRDTPVSVSHFLYFLLPLFLFPSFPLAALLFFSFISLLMSLIFSPLFFTFPSRSHCVPSPSECNRHSPDRPSPTKPADFTAPDSRPSDRPDSPIICLPTSPDRRPPGAADRPTETCRSRFSFSPPRHASRPRNLFHSTPPSRHASTTAAAAAAAAAWLVALTTAGWSRFCRDSLPPPPLDRRRRADRLAAVMKPVCVHRPYPSVV